MTVPRTICLGFLAVITVGTLLLLLPFSLASGTWSSPVTALFTATSAVCVTGLSVVDVGKFYSFWGQLVIVLLVQVGGLGYMTATTVLLLLLGRKLGLRDKVAIQQSLDMPGLSGMALLVRSIIATTLIFEITGVLLLLPVFVPRDGLAQGLWLAIFHSVNSFNNAGFSLFSDNLIGYVRSPLVNLVVPLLIIAGGIGYQVIMEAFLWSRDRWQRRQEKGFFSLNFKIATSTTLVLLILGTLAFFVVEGHNIQTLGTLSWPDRLMAAWFQSVTPRTAGFNTIDITKMTNAGLFITIALMFIGASPGGTGGGIKTTTLRILFSATRTVLRGQDDIVCYQRRIPLSLTLKAIAVAMGSFITVIGATILIALTDPNLDFIHILFEVVSAFATVGLSAVGTAQISLPGQLILVGVMYVGRVGVLLLMAAVLGDPKPTFLRYPEENLLVG